MRNIFKRRRPAPQPAPASAPANPDILTAHAWGLDLDEWDSMTDFERAECRRNVVAAPRFKS